MIVLTTAFALIASNAEIPAQTPAPVKKPLVVEAEEDAAALLEEADELELDEIVFDEEVSDFEDACDEE